MRELRYSSKVSSFHGTSGIGETGRHAEPGSKPLLSKKERKKSSLRASDTLKRSSGASEPQDGGRTISRGEGVGSGLLSDVEAFQRLPTRSLINQGCVVLPPSCRIATQNGGRSVSGPRGRQEPARMPRSLSVEWMF